MVTSSPAAGAAPDGNRAGRAGAPRDRRTARPSAAGRPRTTLPGGQSSARRHTTHDCLTAIRCNILPPDVEAAQILVRPASTSRRFARKSSPVVDRWCLKDLVSDWPAVRAGARITARARRRHPRLRSRPACRTSSKCPPRSGAHLLSRRHERHELHARTGDHQRDARSPARRCPRSGSAPRCTSNRRRIPSTCPISPTRMRSRCCARRWRRASGSAIALNAQTHFDLSTTSPAWWADGGASRCFRPNSCPNLYVGPLDFTMSGPPVSMVTLHNPDFARYPRFKEALRGRAKRRARTGRCAVHSVRLVAPRRIADAVQRAGELLVERRATLGSPFDCMLHAVLSVARPAARAARGVAHIVRTLCVPSRRMIAWRTCRSNSAACSARRRPSAPRPYARSSPALSGKSGGSFAVPCGAAPAWARSTPRFTRGTLK